MNAPPTAQVRSELDRALADLRQTTAALRAWLGDVPDSEERAAALERIDAVEHQVRLLQTTGQPA